MTLTDETLMRWMRGVPGGGLDDADIALSADVSSLLPVLFVFARYLVSPGGQRPVFVEIGTADGSTALPLCKAADERGGIVHSVDPSGCDRAHELVDRFGYADVWRHHRMRSDEFFASFNEPIMLAFIDGDHSWPQVERDLRNCYDRLMEHGLIIASDFDPLYVGDEPDDPDDYERQCSRGVARAFRRFASKIDTEAAFLAMDPNPAMIIRRPRPREAFWPEVRP